MVLKPVPTLIGWMLEIQKKRSLYPIVINHSISLLSTSPNVKDTVIFVSIFIDSLQSIGTVFVAAVGANLGIVRQTALSDSMRQGARKGATSCVCGHPMLTEGSDP